MGLLDKLRANASHQTPKAEGRVKDPVCGMRIFPHSAAATSLHLGKTIHFCSRNCKSRFDAEPARYLP